METNLKKMTNSNQTGHFALYDPKKHKLVSVFTSTTEYNEIFGTLQTIDIRNNNDMLILLDFTFRVHSDPEFGHLAACPLVQYHEEAITEEEMYRILETCYVNCYAVPTFKALSTSFSVCENPDTMAIKANVYANTFYNKKLETIIQNGRGFSINRFLISHLL